jgi:anti-sigma B factor antagonist
MRPPTAEAPKPPTPFAGGTLMYDRLPAAAGAARLKLTGDLDLATADHARAAIRSAQDESRILICDLAELSFIGVAGLRVLMEAAADAERTGRRLIVANSPPILTRMLRLLRLDHALEVPAAPLRTPPGRDCDAFRRHVS